MRLKSWFSIVAMIGVLVHAGAVVRHNSAMLGSALVTIATTDATQPLQSFASVVFDKDGLLLAGPICHAGSKATVPSPGGDGGKNKSVMGCPICAGAISSAIILAADVPTLARTIVHANLQVMVFETTRHAPQTLPPPSRGPPAIV